MVMKPKSMWSCWWQWRRRGAGVIGGEVDGDGLEGHDVDDVFAQATEGLGGDLRDLKGVAVEMDGMLVAAAVAQQEAVALAGGDADGVNVRPGLVVDGPGVELGAFLRADVVDG